MKMTKKQMEEMVESIVGRSLSDLHKSVAENQKKHEDMMKVVLASQGETAKSQSQRDNERGLRTGRFLRALAAGGGNTEKAAAFAKAWGDEILSKALGESTLAGGGALVPEDMAQDVIELLRARTVVRRMGAMQVPMPNGNLTLPFVATGVAAAYGGENQNSNKDEQTFGDIEMSAKKLTVLTPISNDLLNDASIAADTLVREDMLQAASVREDIAFIRDDGTVGTPRGMLNQPNTTIINSTGTSVTAVIDDLGQAIQTLEDNNIPMVRPGWLFAPRTKKHLMTLLDANSNRVFADEMARGTLMGFPFAVTTQIPTNLGGGTNESEVYFADFASLMIGETAGISVKVFDGATYFDGTSLQSGVSRDQTVLRMIARHDFAARQRGNEIHVIDALTWGV